MSLDESVSFDPSICFSLRKWPQRSPNVHFVRNAALTRGHNSTRRPPREKKSEIGRERELKKARHFGRRTKEDNKEETTSRKQQVGNNKEETTRRNWRVDTGRLRSSRWSEGGQIAQDLNSIQEGKHWDDVP